MLACHLNSLYTKPLVGLRYSDHFHH